jgi:hypothetical protein
MTLSGDGTITGLVAGGLPDATITTDELAAGAALNNAPNSVGFRNRIINGDMRIAQRGTSATPTAGGYFTIDRWRFGQAASYAASLTPTISQSSTAPVGFTNSFLYTNGTGAAPTSTQLISIDQYIEGLNCTDLGFGTANAATVTVSFWVRASVTGTYSVALTNSSIDRSYVATYTISAADTWEYKTLTIAGDTSGTWLTTNGTGILVRFPLGAGSNFQTTAGAWQAGNYYTTSATTNLTATTGATFYITGVQLEVGSVATPFERRPFGAELALCQRYYQRITDWQASGNFETTTAFILYAGFPVNMRSAPTVLRNSTVSVGSAAGVFSDNGSLTFSASSTNGFAAVCTVSSGSATVGLPVGLNLSTALSVSSEL